MSDKRIIDLPTLQTALGNDAWLVVDIESGATYKIKKSALLGLQSLETQSQEVYGAINEVRSLAEDLVSDEYDATSAYAKGDYCIYNNTLYKCTTAIATGGEAWNASHWSATKCDDELIELKQSLDNIADISTFTLTVANKTGTSDCVVDTQRNYVQNNVVYIAITLHSGSNTSDIELTLPNNITFKQYGHITIVGKGTRWSVTAPQYIYVGEHNLSLNTISANTYYHIMLSVPVTVNVT